jgi:hypothetical protein
MYDDWLESMKVGNPRCYLYDLSLPRQHTSQNQQMNIQTHKAHSVRLCMIL